MTFPVLISETEIEAGIKQVAMGLAKRIVGKRVIFVTVLEGGARYAQALHWALMTLIDSPTIIEFGALTAKSYKGTDSTGKVAVTVTPVLNQLLEDVYVWSEHEIVIVDDIYDTGLTLREITTLLHDHYGVPYERMNVQVLLCKQHSRPVTPIPGVLITACFDIPDKFVVGFGLDYNGKYRDLPHIAEFQP